MGGPLAKEGLSAKYENTSKFILASQKVFSYILYERPNDQRSKMWIVLLFLWNISTGINAGKMELKFNIDHKPTLLEPLVNSTAKLNSNELGALKRQSLVHKHGNRTYKTDFLLS